MVYFSDNSLMLSGSKEKIETESITPLAKLIEALIIFFVFLIFKNMGIIPSKVERPATPVTKKENVTLFILKNMFFLEKNYKL